MNETAAPTTHRTTRATLTPDTLILRRSRQYCDASGRYCVAGVTGRSYRQKFGRRPMDRLLRVALEKLVRAGTLRVTTADGSTFTLGDGSGKPVAIRFVTREAQRSILL